MLRIPVQRKSAPLPTLLSLPSKATLSRRRQTQSNPSTPLISCKDEIYYTNVTIGTQTTQLIIDTGSADTWVAANSYSPQSSQTSSLETSLPTFSIQYVDGDSVTGTQYSDLVSFSDPTQTFQQTLAVVQGSDWSDSFKVICVEDGLMGFGFQSVSRNDLPTPIQNLHAQNKIEKMQFGFFVGSVNSIDSVGEITLGGYDPDHFLGDLTFVPVAKRSLREMYPNDDLSNYSAMQRNEKIHYSGYWDIDIDEVELNGRNIGSGSNGAVIDSGTTIIYGPRSAVLEIYNELNAHCYFLDTDPNNNFYERQPCSNPSTSQYQYQYATVPCSTEVSLKFKIGGTLFEFNSQDIFRGYAENACDSEGPDYFADCLGTCVGLEDEEWIGDHECDDGKFGIHYNCPRLGCDGKDCSGPCGEELCMINIEVNDFGNNSWLMGDTFMKKVYTAHDYENKQMGFAYSKQTTPNNIDTPTSTSTSPPTPTPMYIPTPSPSPSSPINSSSKPVLIAAGSVSFLLSLFLAIFILKKCSPSNDFRKLENFDEVLDFEDDDEDDKFGEGGVEMTEKSNKNNIVAQPDPVIFEI
ncbi:hypothetical protein TrLO_g4486 [Triparma laevis f. longispina]|uniref:Peptidase A1 domain-containing protein n=1 Tax=Triparma laevis f. longispina TaxID=1714387 RepID=A0A9W6ZNW7_9STRA|nr:hypothetical protein TrLO_g4486 [Triparma laevis f. longispina]